MWTAATLNSKNPAQLILICHHTGRRGAIKFDVINVGWSKIVRNILLVTIDIPSPALAIGLLVAKQANFSHS